MGPGFILVKVRYARIKQNIGRSDQGGTGQVRRLCCLVSCEVKWQEKPVDVQYRCTAPLGTVVQVLCSVLGASMRPGISRSN